MTKAETTRKIHYHRMAEGLKQLEAALQGRLAESGVIPPEWHAIAQGQGAGAKVKLTLWVEADVLRFFRAMGRGHTTRMADVLRTFMQARLAGVVKGPEDVDYSWRPDDSDRARARQMLEEMRARMARGEME
jgi:uncharacterized protein (DUF4415 family)